MRVLKAIGAAILATASILGGIGSFAQWAGIEFTGVVGVVVGAAPAWLPIASLLFGILIGWNAKKWQESKRLKARDEEVSELQNQVAELEKRPTQEQLDEEIEREEAEHARIIKAINSLSIEQSDLVELAFEERRGYRIPMCRPEREIADSRTDVFNVLTESGEYAIITLTPEWNVIMNQHGDEFFEIWNRRKANLLD